MSVQHARCLGCRAEALVSEETGYCAGCWWQTPLQRRLRRKRHLEEQRWLMVDGFTMGVTMAVVLVGAFVLRAAVGG